MNCQRITSKILDLNGSTPEPVIWPGDTGQRIPCFDSCQLMTTLMCNQLSPGLPKELESVRVNIGIPVVRTDGRSVARSVGHVITKFSGMVACSKRSDSGERCEVKKAMKSRGGLGREVRERL